MARSSDCFYYFVLGGLYIFAISRGSKFPAQFELCEDRISKRVELNTLIAAKISEVSKFDFEKKRYDKLRGDVWAQPKRRVKRASQTLICQKFNSDYENTFCFYPSVRLHRKK